MVRTIFALALYCVPIAANSQELIESSDETDLSRYYVVESGEETPKLAEVAALREEYIDIIRSSGCEEALPLITEFHKSANSVANIIRRGNEPFYDASRDEREAVMRKPQLRDELVAAERAFNALLRDRNEAWVEEARCMIEMGNSRDGVAGLMRALNFISPSETEIWQKARQLLWEQVEYVSE